MFDEVAVFLQKDNKKFAGGRFFQLAMAMGEWHD
jgi:hypothetical protein